MLSFTTQNKLANLIQTISEGERKLEAVRQVLAEQHLFEPYSAFRRIDRDRKGYLTYLDLKAFLKENKIFMSDEDVFNVFSIYDTNNDGKIAYSNFLKNILPKDNSTLKSLCMNRESYYVPPDETLQYEIEWALSRVLDQEAKNFSLNDSLKRRLNNAYDFNIRDAFNLIDQENLGYLEYFSIQNFLKSLEKSLSENEIIAFIRYCDKDEDGKISYSEFVQAILASKSDLLGASLSLSTYKEKVKSHNPNYSFSSAKKLTQSQVVSDYDSYLTKKSNQKAKELENSQYKDYLRSKSRSPARTYETPKKYAKNLELADYDREYETPKAHFSPLPKHEELHLAKALKKQIDMEREIEEVRQTLALKSDFNLLDAFRFIDRKARGFISRIELEIALNDINIFPRLEELKLFFERYDRDSDGLMKYSDFVKAISPSNESYSKILHNREPHYIEPYEDGLRVFSFETRNLYKRLLNLHFDCEVAGEILRQKLSKRPYFDAGEAFDALDQNDKGYLTVEEFKKALNNYGIYTSSNDLKSLVKRFDRDEDGRVSFKEFVNEIRPHSPKKY